MNLKALLCKIIGHGTKYSYTVFDTREEKTYKITTCHRCWKETKKEVE
jgi:hypothetical protein